MNVRHGKIFVDDTAVAIGRPNDLRARDHEGPITLFALSEHFDVRVRWVTSRNDQTRPDDFVAKTLRAGVSFEDATVFEFNNIEAVGTRV